MIIPKAAIEAAKRIPPRTNKDWEKLVEKRDNRTGRSR